MACSLTRATALFLFSDMAWFEKYEQPGTSGRIANHGDPQDEHAWARDSVIDVANANACEEAAVMPRHRV